MEQGWYPCQYLKGLHKGPEQDADGVALPEQLDETGRPEEPQKAQVQQTVLWAHTHTHPQPHPTHTTHHTPTTPHTHTTTHTTPHHNSAHTPLHTHRERERRMPL